MVRYGGRLGDLEKKLVGAYRDVVSTVCISVMPRLTRPFQTTVDVPNDEGMFEDGEEADHFASYVTLVCIS